VRSLPSPLSPLLDPGFIEATPRRQFQSLFDGKRGWEWLGISPTGIQFEQRPGDPEPGRLVGSTAWVNEAHPAYRRAVASRSEGYHVALAGALALAPLAVEPAALDRKKRGRSR
jgi:hypothetical protein